MKYIYFLLIPALFFLGSCEENTTQSVFDHNASLEGYVLFEDGSPDTLSAEVSASRNNLILAVTQTDTCGYYLMEELSTGEYYISIALAGYSRKSFSVILTNDILVTADTLTMEPMASMQMATRVVDGVIDGGWLPVYTDDHVSNWGPNDFEELYMAYDDEYLYIAVTGAFSTSDNTVTICIDKDDSAATGIYNFMQVSGGDIGDHIRKEITAPETFGADIAFNSGWSLAGGEGVVSIDKDNPSAVDTAMLEDVVISMNSSVIEFAISLQEMYGSPNLPEQISLIGYIGGGDNLNFANDVIPQGGGDFGGTFLEVFTIGF
ncbi:MAG: hypothetical protein K9N06_02850 [Candidatus Cloacimonetes bacterium]|nr:hypothetical protein [Candidatus Cloacimonadota bacterium]